MTDYASPEDYLKREYEAETKSEYHDGVIIPRDQPPPERAHINSNLIGEIGTGLLGSICQGFNSDMRVFVAERGSYFYPDISAVCGKPRYQHIQKCWSLTNPTLIVDVASASTQSMDRIEKFLCYQTLESLQTYVLVSQDTPRVECYERQADNSWLYRRTEGLDAAVTLESIGCTLRLADIYARVTFTATPTESAEPEPGELQNDSQEKIEI